MTWNPHVTVAAVVEREGRLLFVEERVDGRLVLNQPAGHVEDGESLVAAAIRETLEETAWEFQPEGVVGIYRWRKPENGETYFRFCFAGIALRHVHGRALDKDIERALWLTPEEFAKETHRQRSPLVQRALLDYLHGRRYPLQMLQDVASL